MRIYLCCTTLTDAFGNNVLELGITGTPVTNGQLLPVAGDVYYSAGLPHQLQQFFGGLCSHTNHSGFVLKSQAIKAPPFLLSLSLDLALSPSPFILSVNHLIAHLLTTLDLKFTYFQEFSKEVGLQLGDLVMYI